MELIRSAVFDMVRPPMAAAGIGRAAPAQNTGDKEKEDEHPLSAVTDAYVREEKAEPAGLYRLGADAEGRRKIYFDAPERAADDPAGPGSDPNASSPSKKAAADSLGQIGHAENTDSTDGPDKNAGADGPDQKAGADGPDKKTDGPDKSKPGRKVESCRGNTDKVDREIEQLKKKKKELEQKLHAETDEAKIKDLERKLAQVERELQQKDNDGYRRQHSVFT